MVVDMAKTRAQENRAIRQEALREQLAAQGHLQHVVETLEEFKQPMLREEGAEDPQIRIQRLKAKIDGHLKLVDKYLPSLKAVEHEGSGGGDISVNAILKFGG